MVKLNKIYTRTGDGGETGLTGGQRCPKYDLRVQAYGTVDEANSVVGLARLHSQGQQDIMLQRIQHDLFDLGADLSTPYGGDEENALRMLDTQATRLEQEMDLLNEKLAPLNSFVLPGGTELAAQLHMARTVVRRAERMVCELADQEKINPYALKYLNRLSDFLFVCARAVNNNGEADILWEPGVNR